jgi:hypothetical protein
MVAGKQWLITLPYWTMRMRRGQVSHPNGQNPEQSSSNLPDHAIAYRRFFSEWRAMAWDF